MTGAARLLGALLLVASLAACERGPLAPPTLEPLLVRVDGPRLRDAKGRVVILRGVDLIVPELAGASGVPTKGPIPRDEQFAQVRSLGFNLVRLPVAWAAVEIRPGQHDYEFLRDRLDRLLRAASDHGMQAIVALHQPWSSCFLDASGTPAWTCADPETPAPAQEGGFGPQAAVAAMRAARAQCSFFRDARAPGGRLLREHYVETWVTLARYYDQDRRIFGFDLVNEPSPGSCFPAESFVATVLTPFYSQLRDAIRAAGAPQALLYQPAVSRESALLGAPAKPDALAVFAPHLFPQSFGPPQDASGAVLDALPRLYDRAEQLATTVGGPLLVGEVGGDLPPEDAFRPSSLEMIGASLDELDRRLASGALWAWVPRAPSTPDAPEGGPEPSVGLRLDDPDVAAAVSRPYARRIAGIPLEMRFDATSRTFTLRYQDDPDVRPPDPTEIFVPAPRLYPDGFAVEVSGGGRWKYDEHNQRVLVYRGDGDTHEVRITPAAR